MESVDPALNPHLEQHPRSRHVHSIPLVVGLSTVLLLAAPAGAQAPPGYYNSVDDSTGAALRTTLHEVIDDHTRYPYSSTATDTWNILEQADEDPADPNRILDVYRNASYPKYGGGNSYYNREHSWPSSHGFPHNISSNVPYTDCHQLFLVDDGYNSARSNKPYRSCDASCSELVTDVNNGQGGGSGVYPGNSNWESGFTETGTFEAWQGRRGDVARAVLYMDVRYEGGTHGVTGASEPDLILTDNDSLITADTVNNRSVAYMGLLSTVIQWHLEDPVDDFERNRNELVSSYQGNRNPFVDHPEWVECIFLDVCGVLSAPTGLVAAGGDGFVDLDWIESSHPDLAGYNVYRSTTAGGPYSRLNGATVALSAYTDNGVTNGATYYYVVTAVDTSSNESGISAETSATPDAVGQASDPWINELHYDNASTDTGEFVEIAGPAGLDLTGWEVYGYNGNGGGSYKVVSLSGVIPEQVGCMGTLAFAFSSMQNGAPDGLALVDPAGTVIEFISYEGTLVATEGPANGMLSISIGVAETTSTPVGYSLQLSGTGVASLDFAWQNAAAETYGLPNTDQSFDGCFGCSGDPDCDDGAFCNGVETCVAGACQPGTSVDCDDSVVCTADACNEAIDACENQPDSGICDDGFWCNGAENCDPVQDCQPGTLVGCDDGVVCTTDACDEAADACTNTPDDAACDNGLWCDGDETCDQIAGCQAGTARSCDDGVGCTVDSCNEGTDACVNSPDDGACANGQFCDGIETCDPVADCQAGSNPCPGQQCSESQDACVECLGDGDCGDGQWCNGIETCDLGTNTCQAGSPPACDDSVGCTVDGCDEVADACINTPDAGACDNGLYCDGAETCDPVADCQAGAPVDCADALACTVDSCDEATDSCVRTPDDGACDNGLFCDGTETCDPQVGCQLGSDPCPGQQCSESLGACVQCLIDGHCDDGQWCNGTEWCDLGNNTCQAGTPADCDDAVACTVDSCDEAADACTNAPDAGACDNGAWCDGAETCDLVAGCLAGAPVDCSDGVVCTLDSCDEVTDSCVQTPDDAACGNGSFCDGTETCDPVAGCQVGSDPCPGQQCAEDRDECVECLGDGDCGDGQWCNGVETCDLLSLVCLAGTPVDCVDAVACTVDGCDEAADACTNLPDHGACGNGQFCDGSETCDPVVGCQVGGDPCPGQFCDEGGDVCAECLSDLDCDDGTFCNGDESCFGGACQAGGDPCPGQQCREADDTCVFCLVDGDCDDGGWCNGSEFCDGLGECQAGTAVSCSDGVGCTADACDEATDSCSYTPNDAVCDNGLFCDGAETCDPVLDCQAGSDPCAGAGCDEGTDTCTQPPSQAPWINEFHYDNSKKDRNEGVEVAGPAGTDLSGWLIYAYNGNGDDVYGSIDLSGVISDQQNGYGTLWFSYPKLQNGSPDGLALVDATGAVIEFLSYEGVIVASDGPALGLTSVDVGVAESGSTPRNHSLQRMGSGTQASDFTWAPEGPHTRGAVNDGQAFEP